MYVDPSTYEHVDEAVQDFAREISPKSMNLTEEIGNGEFGNVYRGVWKTEKKETLYIAVKTLKVLGVCVYRMYTSFLPCDWLKLILCTYTPTYTCVCTLHVHSLASEGGLLPCRCFSHNDVIN